MTNPIINQPTSISLQLTDYFLTWQGAQSPSTRKTPVSALSPYYATLSGPNTFAGKITVSSGGASITGNTNVVGTLAASGALSAGGAISTSSGGILVTGNSTITGTLGGLTGLTVASGGASITGTLSATGQISTSSGGAAITGNSSIGGTFSTSGLYTATGGTVVPNSVFYSAKDVGGTARQLLTINGANNVEIINGGGAQTIFLNQTQSVQTGSVDNAGNWLFTASAGIGVAPYTGSGVGILAAGNAVFSPPSPSAGFAWCVFNSGTLAQGSITFTGSGTAFNTSSDETLKLIDGPLSESGPIIDALEPIWFRWRSNPDGQRAPGFGAQTTHKVFPWAVSPGDGDRPWQMDAAKLMPLVIAELQELRARVAELEEAAEVG